MSRNPRQIPFDPPPAQKPILIEEGEIHVWKMDLATQDENIEKYARVISNDETKIAERYKFQKDRLSYIARHGLLRLILSRYLPTEAGSLDFSYGPHGKPYISKEQNILGIQFSLSSSSSIGLLGITRNNPIGIDIEHRNTDIDFQGISELYFSESEISHIRENDDLNKSNEFYRIWTMKEAYLKAVGSGMSMGTDTFSVPLTPKDSSPHIDEFRINELSTPSDDYAAAVSVMGNIYKTQYWEWYDPDNI